MDDDDPDAGRRGPLDQRGAGHLGALPGPLALTKANVSSIFGGPIQFFTPDASIPGQYQVASQSQLGVIAASLAWDFDVGMTTGVNGVIGAFNALIADLLSANALWIPSLLGQDFPLTVYDLSTGYEVFSDTFPLPPAVIGGTGDIPLITPNPFADSLAPVPLLGRPLRILAFTAPRSTRRRWPVVAWWSPVPRRRRRAMWKCAC